MVRQSVVCYAVVAKPVTCYASSRIVTTDKKALFVQYLCYVYTRSQFDRNQRLKRDEHPDDWYHLGERLLVSFIPHWLSSGHMGPYFPQKPNHRRPVHIITIL